MNIKKLKKLYFCTFTPIYKNLTCYLIKLGLPFRLSLKKKIY